MNELENSFLRKLLVFNLPSRKTFMSKILPQVSDNLTNRLKEKLKDAQSMCLIVDLWSNLSNQNYLALAVSVIFKDFSKEIRVIGMVPTNGSSNAESIKDCIEQIVNKYEFDKRKICGVVCDEGSSLVRLFKQNQNYLFDEYILTESESIFIRENNTNELSEDETGNREQLNDLFRYNLENVDKEIRAITDTIEDWDDWNNDFEDDQNDADYVQENDDDEDEDDDNDDSEESDPDENQTDNSINILSIQLETNSVPRYSCMAHK